MEHEKIIVRDDGLKIRITASITVEWHSNEPKYDYYIHTCQPKKRTWRNPFNFDNDYDWRKRDLKERIALERQKYLEIVSVEEINQTLLELWDKIKPILL